MRPSAATFSLIETLWKAWMLGNLARPVWGWGLGAIPGPTPLFIGSADAGERAANLLTLVSTAHRNDLDVWMYLKDALDQLLAGSTDYESLRADVWKQSHPEAVRTYRSDERRDTADRNRLTRAQRRLASAKKLAAAKLAVKTNEAEPQKSKPNKARP